MKIFKWKKGNLLGLFVYMITGSSMAIPLGYIVYAARGTNIKFNTWLNSFFYNDVHWWVLYGAVIAFGLCLGKKLLNQ